MYEFEIKPPLEKKLRKFKRKDAPTYGRIRNKIFEVMENPEHYKPLSYDLKGLRRAHIGSFVLSFYIKSQVVHFIDYEHHDKAYQ
jgi:mRNA-degrading endonuclease RelE of RelBE toxin-antitoxin system